MAEASSVENLALNRFYCHKCNSEINRALPDFTCPNCHNGFIEALEPAEEEPDEESDSEPGLATALYDALQDFLEFQEELAARRVRRNRMFRRTPGNTSSLRILNSSGLPSSNLAPSSRGRTSSTSSGLRSRRNRRMLQNESRTEPIEALVQELLFEFSGGGVDARANGPVFLLSNPGDYAWGREGLDAIVTMLLNQMEVSGPPPLSTEKIQEIPVVVITQAQVDSSLQCSVCWEDFKFEEPVRKLACDHVYHEPCIIPWLELHGTCPICRKTLNEDGTLGDPSNSNPDVNSLEAFFRGQQGRSSSNTSSTSASTSSSTGAHSSLVPESFNMDLDYD